MNKKFSTLMAISLMALSTSAFAADVLPLAGSAAKKVEGKKYFLVQNVINGGGQAGIDKEDLILGMSKNVDDSKLSYNTAKWNGEKFETADDFSVNNYLWTVEEKIVEGTTDQYYYQFKNVATGELLRVLNTKPGDGDHASFVDKVANTDAYNSGLVSFALYQGNDRVKYSENGGLFVPNAWLAGWNVLNFTLPHFGVHNYTADGAPGNQTFQLYEVTDDPVAGDALNELYNAAGFNFEFVTKAYNSSIDNPFNNEALRAITLAADIQVDGEQNFVFPAGTYFITDGPRGSFPATGTIPEKVNYLLNCTFIAVSPSTNISTNKDKQNDGEGFQLTTVKGKDLNFLKADLSSATLANIADSKKPCGSTINVNNAAFSVFTNTVNNANQYALKLAHFYYNKKDAKATDVQSNKAVYLNVASDASYSGQQGLVTLPGTTNKFIFKFVESNVAKGTSFLSADGKSVYNITVFDQWGEAFNLGSLNNAGTPGFYAAGDAVADVDAPAYQFVVTDVNGNDVTLTNRASGDELVAKFFTQEDGLYTLAAKNVAQTFEVLDVNNQGDVKARKNNDGTVYTQKFHQSWVALTPADVEEISGLDVEDGTKVTIAFARDNAPTSNKMYPKVTCTTGVGTHTHALATELTDEVSEAAQWQLVKNEIVPNYVTRTFAYLDKDEKVAYKTKGDTIAYYTYKLQLVEDGNPVEKAYLGWNSTYTVDLANAYDFVIKENLDGSVLISAKSNINKYLSVKDYDDVKQTIKEELNRNLVAQNVLPTSAATDIKTYLVQDAPEVSLPATSSYVTLKSEMGNYISMNEEKDGIVVNSDPLTFLVHAADLKSVVPSFFISTGWNEEDGARDFLFNPQDSINYYVANGAYDKKYQWAEDTKKAIFKSAILNETNDTITTSVKGKVVEIAKWADNKGTKGGLNRFKYQIVLAENEDDLYVIRQLGAGVNGVAEYLSSVNDKLTWDGKNKALKFHVADTTAPTANEAIAAEGVQVIGGQGVVTVQGAAGKVVTVANILGQTIANQVAASDNVTIAVPAGIVVVAVDGEATKVVVK